VGTQPDGRPRAANPARQRGLRTGRHHGRPGRV